MRLLIVDGSNLVMRCALGGDLGPAQAVPTATHLIERAAREWEASHLVVALDCPGVDTWRKQLYPAYKANRTRDTAPWLYAAHAHWSRAGWWVEAVGGYEADDVIATVALRASARTTAPGDAVMVLSGDSDVLALTAHNILILKPLTGGQFAEWRAEQVRQKYGVSAERLVDLKALTGESGDNVPGVDGIGLVRAQRLLAAHGDLEAVIAAGTRNACSHSAKVAAAAALARLSRQLVTLSHDVPVVPIQPKACVF